MFKLNLKRPNLGPINYISIRDKDYFLTSEQAEGVFLSRKFTAAYGMKEIEIGSIQIKDIITSRRGNRVVERNVEFYEVYIILSTKHGPFYFRVNDFPPDDKDETKDD